LKVLQAAVPIVIDAEMTAGGIAPLPRRGAGQEDDAAARRPASGNAIFAAFGALKDLDLVIVGG